jgi:hypothetical protein
MLSHDNNSEFLPLAQVACASVVIGKQNAETRGNPQGLVTCVKEEISRLIVVIPVVAKEGVGVSNQKVSSDHHFLPLLIFYDRTIAQHDCNFCMF